MSVNQPIIGVREAAFAKWTTLFTVLHVSNQPIIGFREATFAKWITLCTLLHVRLVLCITSECKKFVYHLLERERDPFIFSYVLLFSFISWDMVFQ